MFDRVMSEGRGIGLPSVFFFAPLLVFRMRHYEPIQYISRVKSIYHDISRLSAMWKRASRGPIAVRVLNAARSLSVRRQWQGLVFLEEGFTNDHSVRRFYEGRSAVVPEMLIQVLKARLGPYFELLEPQALSAEAGPDHMVKCRSEAVPAQSGGREGKG